MYQVQYFFVFEPKKYPREILDERFTPLEIKAEDGTPLEGMIYSPKNFSHTILYMGGRSQDSVALITKLSASFENYRIIAYNYRGYGDSKGSLSEENIFNDALFVARKLQENYGEMSILGFSLGGSLAAYTASNCSVNNLFLISPFDSVYEVIKRKMAFFPSRLIRYRFDTALHVKQVDAKTYVVASKSDRLIPIENIHNLLTNVKNLEEFKELDGYNHDEVLFSPETVDLVQRILQ